LALAPSLSACATGDGAKRPAHTVEAVGKVIESLMGERFTARSRVVAVVSTSSGDVALEQK
jgi:hypothetical protein